MDDNIFQREVLDRLIKLETLLQQQDYKGVNDRLDKSTEKIINHENELNNHDERLKKIEDNSKWLWRTIAAAFILGAIAIIFKI